MSYPRQQLVQSNHLTRKRIPWALFPTNHGERDKCPDGQYTFSRPRWSLLDSSKITWTWIPYEYLVARLITLLATPQIAAPSATAFALRVFVSWRVGGVCLRLFTQGCYWSWDAQISKDFSSKQVLDRDCLRNRQPAKHTKINNAFSSENNCVEIVSTYRRPQTADPWPLKRC